MGGLVARPLQAPASQQPVVAICRLSGYNYLSESLTGGQTSCAHPVSRRLAGWPDWIGWSQAQQMVPGAWAQLSAPSDGSRSTAQAGRPGRSSGSTTIQLWCHATVPSDPAAWYISSMSPMTGIRVERSASASAASMIRLHTNLASRPDGTMTDTLRLRRQ